MIIKQLEYRQNENSIYFHHSTEEKSPETIKLKTEAHSAYEVFYLHEGDVEYIIEGIKVRVFPGNVLIINQAAMHSIVKNMRHGDYERSVLQFSKNSLPSNHPEIFNLLDELFSVKGRRQYLLLPKSIVEKTEINDIFTKIEALCEHSQNDKYFIPYLVSHIIMLVIGICKGHALLEKNATDETVQQNPLVLSCIDYINKHIDSVLSVDELADALNISKYYLSHTFSKHMEISLKQYVLLKKMWRAKNLIESGRSAYEVSIQLGYSYYSSFYHAYVSVIGHSPTNKEANPSPANFLEIGEQKEKVPKHRGRKRKTTE